MSKELVWEILSDLDAVVGFFRSVHGNWPKILNFFFGAENKGIEAKSSQLFIIFAVDFLVLLI